MPRIHSLCLLCFSLALLVYTAGAARAQTYGRLLTREEIYAFSVQDLRLGMAQEEAASILKKNHWEGVWTADNSPEVPSSFSKGRSRLYLMRCSQPDKKLHLWGIVEKEPFDWPHDSTKTINRALGDVWIDTVVDQFGASSMEFSNPDGVNAYVYYLMDQSKTYMPKLEVYLNSYETSYELTDQTMLTPQQRAMNPYR